MANISDLKHGDWVGYTIGEARFGIAITKLGLYANYDTEDDYIEMRNHDGDSWDETYQNFFTFSTSFMEQVTRILRFPDEETLKDWVYGKIDV